MRFVPREDGEVVVVTVNGTRCCAKCKTPFGHSVEAGRCCHPSDSEFARREMLHVEVNAQAELGRQKPSRPGPKRKGEL